MLVLLSKIPLERKSIKMHPICFILGEQYFVYKKVSNRPACQDKSTYRWIAEVRPMAITYNWGIM